MRKLLFLSLFICLALTQTACKRDGKYIELKNAQWKIEDALKFDWDESLDNKTPKKIVLAMRYVANLPVKELKLNMEITAPSGKVASKEVIVSLKDAKGMHIGKVMGDIGDIDTVVEEKFTFPEAGKYKFAIKQNVASAIVGIQEVGLRIIPVKS